MNWPEYRLFEGTEDISVMQQLTALNQKLFGFNETIEALRTLFQSHKTVLICLAIQDDLVVGFKVGFLAQDGSFDSWRGGVCEHARRQGIATQLMKHQHEWCKNHGVRIIKTTTDSDNHAMLILNLQSGFSIVGSFMNRRIKLKILLEKWLR